MVVEVGGGDVHVQRQPPAITDSVDLGAGLAPVDRAGPGQVPLTCSGEYVKVADFAWLVGWLVRVAQLGSSTKVLVAGGQGMAE
jgi:hypothetical protein